MKIYVAASFVAQKRLRPIRDRLFEMNHNVIGSWLDEVSRPHDMPQEVFDRKLAAKDLQEVKEADCLILDTSEPSTTGGRMIEFGFALAQHDKLVYHVGEDKSIFMHLADIHFETWDDLFEYFSSHHQVASFTATGMEDKEFTAVESIG